MSLKPSLANPENYDITPLDGWDIAPGATALCERCAAGWKPSAVAEVERLRKLLVQAIETIDEEWSMSYARQLRQELGDA